MSIGVRLLLAFVAALLPVFAMEAFNSYTLYRATLADVQKLALQQSLSTAADVNQIIEATRGLLNAVALTDDIDPSDPAKCAVFLKSVVTKSEALLSISVADEKGNLFCSSIDGNQTVNIADRQYFQEAQNSNNVVVGTYVVGRSDKHAILPVAIARTMADGTKAGVVVGAIGLDWLSQHIIDRGYATGGSVTIADRNGIILARQPLPDKFMGTSVPEEFLHLLQNPAPGTFEALSRDGNQRIYGYVPIAAPPVGLYVSTGLSTELSFAPLRQSINGQLVTFGVLLLVSLLIAFIANRVLISNPVNHVLGTIHKWQSGDVTARTNLHADAGEIGKIGEEFDKAATALAAREESINLLLGEIQHRAKNQITLMLTFVRQIAKNQKTVPAFAEALNQRLLSLARSQDLLLKTNNKPVDLKDVIEAQLETFDLSNSARVILEGEPVQVAPSVARHVGMAIHELLTNAQKHGALQAESGTVKIAWDATQQLQEITLHWREFHDQAMVEPRSTGFGRVMIERIIPQMLNGQAKSSFDAPGFIWIITFPNPLA